MIKLQVSYIIDHFCTLTMITNAVMLESTSKEGEQQL